MSLTLDTTVALGDGVRIPMFGLGLYMTQPGAVAQEVTEHALRVGYRMLDTASFYKNEESVGAGVRASGLPRKDVFVVTKLWNSKHGEEAATQAAADSLRKLDLGYIDLYLIHAPLGHKLVETYGTLLKLKDKGLIRSVGVSNFGVHHLEGLKRAGLPPPSVNQVELHPWQNTRRAALIQYCHDNSIAVMGYSPVIRMQKQDDPIVNEIAKRYEKTVPQTLIRWSMQRGFITIPKSAHPERIQQNADVFNFSLSDSDMDKLNCMPSYSCAWDPTTDPWVD